jgi:hypothetical protein
VGEFDDFSEFGRTLAISYWVYDDGTDNDPGGSDEDLRGARVLDCADSVNGGVEISVSVEGYFTLRLIPRVRPIVSTE